MPTPSCEKLAGPVTRATAFAVALAIFAAFFILVCLIRSQEPLGLDQGLFACFARWIPRGWLPYRDLYDLKPPLQLYTFVLGFSLGGSTRSLWCFECAYLAGTLFACGVLVGRRFGKWAGLLSALFLFIGLWSPGFGGYWSRAQAEEFVTLPVLGAAFLALASLRRPRLALLTGLLVGLAGLYKIPAMGLAGAWCAFWFVMLGLRGGAQRILYMAAGMTLPWSAAFVWLWAHGIAEEFVGAVFVVYPRQAASEMGLGHVVVSAVRALATELPGPLLGAAIFFVLDRCRGKELSAWLGAWTVFALATVIMQRQLFPYHFLFAVPALAVAAAVACTGLAENLARGTGTRRMVSAIALLAIAGLTAWRTTSWVSGYGPSARLLWAKESRSAALLPFDVPGFSPRTEEAIARYLRDHTRPEQGVLVWGLAPGVYALADRHPITRYAFHKILLTEAPLSRSAPGLAARRKELIETILRDPPAYFVLGQNDANGFDRDDSRMSLLRFPQLADIIRRDYRAEINIGNFLLFRRDEVHNHTRGPE
jgi:hypothetical protein